MTLMRRTSAAAIIVAALAAGSPFKTATAQPDSIMWAGCRSYVLAEQLRDHCLIPDRLAKVIPGFADLASDTPPSCAWTVFLTNPDKNGARAKRILAPLLPDSAKDRQECAPGGIRVRPSRYNRAQLIRVSNRVDSLIDAFGYHRFPVPRTLVFVDSGFVVVTAHNQRALDHLRAAIRGDAAFRPYPIVLRLSDGPQELDPPIRPPRAAALLVLDSLASRFAGQRIAFDTKKLPPGVTVDDLTARRLRPIAPADTGCTTRRIFFWTTKMFEDGRIMFTVHDGDSDIIYDVWCPRGQCKLPWPAYWSGGDYFAPCTNRWRNAISPNGQ